jgi:hypothetical protein
MYLNAGVYMRVCKDSHGNPGPSSKESAMLYHGARYPVRKSGTGERVEGLKGARQEHSLA